MSRWFLSVFVVAWCCVGQASAANETTSFEKIAVILSNRCAGCHSQSEHKGEFSLETADAFFDSGNIEVGEPDASRLIEVITPADGKAEMPKTGEPLGSEEIALVREWIAAGAKWPSGVRIEAAHPSHEEWWSFQPLVRPVLPDLPQELRDWPRTPIDHFIAARLIENGMRPSRMAPRSTLIRRLHFDLIGLPPTPDEVAEFLADDRPQAYERLVDRLLASPRYGERWARHWLDVVHYADTHGYDKDKLRENAWPYRDYVIRSFNDDKPYARFVREQIAGDVLYPGPDGVVATGFIAAGPFDWVGHIELAESLDKDITRNLDRDDMVATTMNAFVSLTAQCARCHDHKFDPISQEDYYSLQAVFAAVDRADRNYDSSPALSARRAALSQARDELVDTQNALHARLQQLAGERLQRLDQRIASLQEQGHDQRPEFGYHSQIEAQPDEVKWVQIDLGEELPIDRITLVGCRDDFNNIGAGFGFPVRYKIQVASNAAFDSDVETVGDRTTADQPNPGVAPLDFEAGGNKARFVRVTATKLAPRQNDFIFALAELEVLSRDQNVAAGKQVTALDSIEQPMRWRKTNLVDGYYDGGKPGDAAAELELAQRQRASLLEDIGGGEPLRQLRDAENELARVNDAIGSLPEQKTVFAAATHFKSQGNFRSTEGKPRPIHLLRRGEVQSPLDAVGPGTVACLPKMPSRFQLPADHAEGERRAALANWITDSRNSLTWRSIVNRVWQYHFGRGLVDTPNDFGHMGATPTHPQLLDWLAVEFRDGGESIKTKGSLKQLHRLMVTSAVYRQVSADNPEYAKLDSGNQYLWRMNRRRLEAEAIRDAVLSIAGKLDDRMYGPGFRPFVLDKPEHSPHYLYEQHDPDDATSHRRSVYRFIVRSVPDPFMETLDCADPSIVVPRRDETVTALSALALLNNDFMVRMAEHFAARLAAEERSIEGQINAAYSAALSRQPTDGEISALAAFAEKHGLASACRVLLNTNEFVFVD